VSDELQAGNELPVLGAKLPFHIGFVKVLKAAAGTSEVSGIQDTSPYEPSGPLRDSLTRFSPLVPPVAT